MKKRVLVGSPVHQKPEILTAFLSSLKRLVAETVTLDFLFVDDNADQESSRMLADFAREGATVTVLPGSTSGDLPYVCDERSHHWRRSLVAKVAGYKNKIISLALEQGYDHVFFVDSDLVLHPSLVEKLESAGKDIVSEIIWTQWQAHAPAQPNVWLFDTYDMVPRALDEVLSEQDMAKRYGDFLAMLRRPGLYEVGGLGACTLLSREALLKGVSFESVSNLTFYGEDRHFCVRAAVLGISLFVDTHYPAYHIYRVSDLAGVAAYLQRTAPQPDTDAQGKKAAQHNTSKE